MDNPYLAKAIRHLKPTAEFSLIDGNYDTIKWDVLEGKAPTKAEIASATEEIKANEAKAALLERLGITAEEAALLLS